MENPGFRPCISAMAAPSPTPGHPEPNDRLRAAQLVLVAEDDPDIADIIRSYLTRDGYRVVHAADGQSALDMHYSLKPDLIVLDVGMPHVDGWNVLSEVRRRGQTPVIMLTAYDQDIDKLMALRIGADDYVVKPFNPAEVAARVGAVLRRSGRSESSTVQQHRVGPVEIDLETHSVYVIQGESRLSLTLTLTEFKLLARMARTPQRVFSRSELLAACLPEGDTLERTVDSHVSKLRKKLEDAGVPGMPVSVRGVGYRLESSG